MSQATELVKRYLDEADVIARGKHIEEPSDMIEIAKMIQMAERWMPIQEKVSPKNKEPKNTVGKYPGIQDVKLPANTKRLYVDAGCYNNGSKHQKAKIAVTTDAELLFMLQIGNKTNNEAEFMAIEAAMLIIQNNIPPSQTEVVICSDSKIAVNMVSGEWRGKKEHLKILAEEVRETWGDWDNIKLMWLPRQSNYAGVYLEFGNFTGKE